MSVKLYDPAKCLITFGPYPLTGIADGTFIQVARDEDSFFKKVGADGEVGRARNKNQGGLITITLLMTSASNDLLSTQQQIDERTGLGVYPLMIKDILGTTLVMAANAWVKKPADVEFAKEITTRDWLFDCDQIQQFVGGSLFFGTF